MAKPKVSKVAKAPKPSVSVPPASTSNSVFSSSYSASIEAIDKVEREGGVENLKIAKEISDTWVDYFKALRTLVEKNSKGDKAGVAVANAYIESQVKLFTLKSKELKKEIAKKGAKKKAKK
ncbi:MAG: hypothetical protein JW727_01720 [Candidatus Aenigmarchaeota archaeon]|nr:hypothetical protein [Candidatus Aenigmarchaeota archaeon]